MAPADIAPARALLSQLGYDMNAKEVKRRYEAIKEKHDHAVFIGEEDGRLVALLHLYERPAFDKPPERRPFGGHTVDLSQSSGRSSCGQSAAPANWPVLRSRQCSLTHSSR
jgi:hypothetical protein